MVRIVKADKSHVGGIVKVCSEGYRNTYEGIYSKKYIDRIIAEFYTFERISGEVQESSREWGGYFVALEEGQVAGACGGGMISNTEGEVFVLYLDPRKRNKGIGTKLLHALTLQQKKIYSAQKQWVSVQKGNSKGIPFYEARGFIYLYEKRGYANTEEEAYLTVRYCRDI
ncbi:GNAT family N-acetyltransferase [Jeotgalibacillus proteolyticus]|uniref:GNAT family N-acetyltransferase n=1 Tax=Jeotgalibacillus proteolyticus TaxID=2082395 RepID=A0A2S5GDE6_9BACL|nr:GNAT family N-acetyltransferase [Jeotgalibacillus proteolyticus]PPA71062.1 GNAT family N-acetyltransferase [Jeotgalibacillus proteolyticus]